MSAIINTSLAGMAQAQASFVAATNQVNHNMMQQTNAISDFGGNGHGNATAGRPYMASALSTPSTEASIVNAVTSHHSYSMAIKTLQVGMKMDDSLLDLLA